MRVWPGENPYSGAELPDFIIDKTPGYLAPLTGRIRYPGGFIPEFAGFPYGGQFSFLPADVLAKEGVCHTRPAPVGR